MRPGDVQALTAYVRQQAPQYNLDPRAVLAVAAQEGLGGGIGDNGSSFGPWQLHQGGAYPASAPQSPPATANAWAWNAAGVDYALGRMSSVAGGLRGAAAVHAIVFGFERPANPAAEYQAALATYNRPGGIGGAGRAGAATGPDGGSAPAQPSGGGGAGGFLSNLLDPHFWLRAMEVVGGGVFLLLGLYLLAREAGVAPSARQALAATPAGRAAKLATVARG